MKANDLMIGDWVEIQDTPKYYKVEGVNIFARGDACRLTFEDYVVETWCDRVKPIPLTPEMLEANGFEQNENVKGYQYPNDNIIFCLEELSRVFIFNGVYNDICINYVHELQHALRLCGLTELADNFKIK